jgi:hypothetical protein
VWLVSTFSARPDQLIRSADRIKRETRAKFFENGKMQILRRRKNANCNFVPKGTASIPQQKSDSGTGIYPAINRFFYERCLMASSLNNLKLLQMAIRHEHQCEAVHHQTVPVHETFDGKTIWKGDVEVFHLNGHAEAKKCFAWWQDEKDKGGRFVTVLEKQLINTPEMAVKSAIYFEAQPAQPFDSSS